MDRPTLALLLAFLVHAAGIVVLLGLALREDGSSWRDWWPRDDDGRGDEPPPVPPAPLPGGEPARVRLRTEHDAVPRRRRRRGPAHAPERDPQRQPS